MATNVSQKDETLNEVMDWCSDEFEKAMRQFNASSGLTAVRNMAAMCAYQTVINHCHDMLGYSGHMPSEVPNQSEE